MWRRAYRRNIEYYRQYRRIHADKYKANRKRIDDRLKIELIAIMGGKCVRCGYSDPRALQVDHVNGEGTKHRKL